MTIFLPFRMKNFCGSTGEPVTSKTNVLHVRYYAEHDAISSQFQILYTAFRDKTVTKRKLFFELFYFSFTCESMKFFLSFVQGCLVIDEKDWR